MGEFPNGPVVRTPTFTAKGWGSIPGPGTKTPQAAWPKKKERWWAGDGDLSVVDEEMEMNEQVSISSTVNNWMDAFTQGQLLH